MKYSHEAKFIISSLFNIDVELPERHFSLYQD